MDVDKKFKCKISRVRWAYEILLAMELLSSSSNSNSNSNSNSPIGEDVI